MLEEIGSALPHLIECLVLLALGYNLRTSGLFRESDGQARSTPAAADLCAADRAAFCPRADRDASGHLSYATQSHSQDHLQVLPILFPW